jgi:hypothetical protein
MDNSEIIVPGVLKPDGTLHLQHVPRLDAGPVEVVIRPAPASPLAEDWWECLQRIRSELEARGTAFATDVEIDSQIAQLRSGDDRMEAVYHDLEWKKNHPG